MRSKCRQRTNQRAILEAVEARQLLSGTYTMIYNFASTYNDPNALVVDSAGNLYGTICGGSNGDGAIFELANGSTTPTILATFNGTNGLCNADNPPSGILIDSQGNLFGTTTSGGDGFTPGAGGNSFDTPGDGVVWELAKNSSTIVDLGKFDGETNYPDGYSPEASIAMDTNGNLFGDTEAGGTAGGGEVWEIAKDSDTITNLASFGDDAFGAEYDGEATGYVYVDGNDDIFGTTIDGSEPPPNSAAGNGAIWEVPAAGHTIETLAVFSGHNGFGVPMGLVSDGSGNLYGLALGGDSSGDGTVFKYNGSALSILGQFGGDSGSFAEDEFNDGFVSQPVFDGSGDVFGVAPLGATDSANSGGDIWEIASGSSTITPLYSYPLNGSFGFQPINLVYDSNNGIFYGTTSGSSGDAGANDGTIFSYSPGAVTASQLVFTAQPANVTAGQMFGSAITVTAEDSQGDVDPSFNGSITLGVKAVPAGGHFTPIVAQAVDGVATFSDIAAIDLAGGYKFKATETGLTPGKSSKFFVTPAAASQLVFSDQPTNVAVGVAEGTITVDVEDPFGNILTDDDSTLVTLGTKIAPAGVSFSPVAIDDVDGVATFTGVIFDTAGGYKLKATHAGLTPGKSAKFFVMA
jgi:uncharacterized repeat protein (TIGR03803 family)